MMLNEHSISCMSSSSEFNRSTAIQHEGFVQN